MPGGTDPDARVLDYHDVLLRQADVDLLNGSHWLNDQVRAGRRRYPCIVRRGCRSCGWV